MNPLSGDNVFHAAARRYEEYEPLQNYPRDVVTAPNLEGATPLITAVKERHFKASLGILRLRPDINVQDCKGNTVLHHAVRNHYLATAGHLCEAGAETCIPNKQGKSYLHFAAVHAYVTTLRRLFKKKLEAAQDVYIRDFLQVTPLIDATKAGN
jgi:ankyrin repeat protein